MVTPAKGVADIPIITPKVPPRLVTSFPFSELPRAYIADENEYGSAFLVKNTTPVILSRSMCMTASRNPKRGEV